MIPALEVAPVVPAAALPDHGLAEEADGQDDAEAAALAEGRGGVVRALVGHQPAVHHALRRLLRRHRHLLHVRPEHRVPLRCRPHALVHLGEGKNIKMATRILGVAT